MSPNLRIAFRFLTAKKRAMLMSLACTILGVGLFIVTQATTSGFERFFIETILGTDGAMRIEDKIQDTLRSRNAGGGSDFLISHQEGLQYIQGVEEPKLLMDALRNFSNVSGASAVLRGNVSVRSSFKSESAQAFGIEVEDHLRVSDLAKQIVDGSIHSLMERPENLLLGRVLADRLQVNVGDPITIQAEGQYRRYRVGGIYETGVSDIDKLRIYGRMTEVRSLLKKPTGVTFIQINVFDKERAPQDAMHIQEVTRHSARPWQVREKTWLSVFRALGVSSAITVSVFTLIAGLAMFNTLAMIVLEKTKDIAILRSMGYSREDISQIFVWQAAIVLAIGTVAGALVGAAATYGVSRIPLPITGIFKTDTFIVDPSIWHYVAAVATAVVVVMVASLVPSRRAARLEPGDVIRGTAQ